MSDLETLEQELEPPIHEVMGKALPEPEMGRLLKVEKTLPLNNGKGKSVVPWLILILGLTGIASAYWLASESREKSAPFKPAYETQVIEQKKPEQKNDATDRQLEQKHEDKNQTPSPMIYRREVVGNE
jgi:hypothetical protein